MTNKKQFSINLIINGLNFLVNVAIGLLMTPFLVNHLGIASFGLVQIAISIAIYGSILSTSLNQSNNRFVSISLAKDSQKKISTLLNTILTLYSSSFLLILPFLLLVAFYPNLIFNVEDKLLSSASYLFLLIGISQLFVMQTTAFMSPLYANNRLDIIQLINILRNSLKLILVFILILFFSNSLLSVGIAFFIASIIAVVIAYINFKKYVPFYKYNFKDFNWLDAKKILYLSGWTVIAVLGNLIFLQTDIILINIFLGSEKSGEFAVLIQWTILLISLTSVLSVVISPIILNKYTYQKIDELKEIFYQSIKFQGIYTAIPVALLFIYADTILSLWLSEKFVYLAPYLQVMIIHFAVVQSTRQLLTINTAYNNMKWHANITLLIGFFHIILSILLLKYTNFGIWTIIISNLFFTLILNLGFLSSYVSKYLSEPVYKIYLNILPAIVTQVFVMTFAYLLKYYLEPNTWFTLTLSLILSFLIVLPFIYFLLLTSKEKLVINKFLKNRFQ